MPTPHEVLHRPVTDQGERWGDLATDWQKADAHAVLSESGMVFTEVDGNPIDTHRITKLFGELVRRSGLPKIRLHDLRHSHTTHLIAAGEQPRTISARLGHSSVIFTQDRYGHLLPNAQATAASAVASLVDGQ